MKEAEADEVVVWLVREGDNMRSSENARRSCRSKLSDSKREEAEQKSEAGRRERALRGETMVRTTVSSLPSDWVHHDGVRGKTKKRGGAGV